MLQILQGPSEEGYGVQQPCCRCDDGQYPSTRNPVAIHCRQNVSGATMHTCTSSLFRQGRKARYRSHTQVFRSNPAGCMPIPASVPIRQTDIRNTHKGHSQDGFVDLIAHQQAKDYNLVLFLMR